MEIAQEMLLLESLGTLPLLQDFHADSTVTRALLQECQAIELLYFCKDEIQRVTLLLDTVGRGQNEALQAQLRAEHAQRINKTTPKKRNRNSKDDSSSKRRAKDQAILEQWLKNPLQATYQGHCVDALKRMLADFVMDLDTAVEDVQQAAQETSSAVNEHYKHHLRLLHPDKKNDNETQEACTARFQAFQSARSILQDTSLRRRYMNDLLECMRRLRPDPTTLRLAHVNWIQSVVSPDETKATTTTTAVDEEKPAAQKPVLSLTRGAHGSSSTAHQQPRKPLIRKVHHKKKHAQIILPISHPEVFHRHCSLVQVFGRLVAVPAMTSTTTTATTSNKDEEKSDEIEIANISRDQLLQDYLMDAQQSEFLVQYTFPSYGDWQISWSVTYQLQLQDPENNLMMMGPMVINPRRSCEETLVLLDPLGQHLDEQKQQVLQLAAQKVTDLYQIHQQLQRKFPTTVDDSCTSTTSISWQGTADNLVHWHGILHRAMVKARGSLARLNKLQAQERNHQQATLATSAKQQQDSNEDKDDPHTLQAQQDLEECLSVVTRSQMRLDQAISVQDQKNRRKNFKLQIARLLESGMAVHWITTVNEKQLGAMGGEPNRLYQLLVEGANATRLEIDAETLENAVERTDLFSNTQRLAILVRKNQVLERIHQEETNALAEARALRLQQQEQDEQARVMAERDQAELEAYKHIGERTTQQQGVLLESTKDSNEGSGRSQGKATSYEEQAPVATELGGGAIVEEEPSKPTFVPGTRIKIQNKATVLHGGKGVVVQQEGTRNRYLIRCDNGGKKHWLPASVLRKQADDWVCLACWSVHEKALALKSKCKACGLSRGSEPVYSVDTYPATKPFHSIQNQSNNNATKKMTSRDSSSPTSVADFTGVVEERGQYTQYIPIPRDLVRVLLAKKGHVILTIAYDTRTNLRIYDENAPSGPKLCILGARRAYVNDANAVLKKLIREKCTSTSSAKASDNTSSKTTARVQTTSFVMNTKEESAAAVLQRPLPKSFAAATAIPTKPPVTPPRSEVENQSEETSVPLTSSPTTAFHATSEVTTKTTQGVPTTVETLTQVAAAASSAGFRATPGAKPEPPQEEFPTTVETLTQVAAAASSAGFRATPGAKPEPPKEELKTDRMTAGSFLWEGSMTTFPDQISLDEVLQSIVQDSSLTTSTEATSGSLLAFLEAHHTCIKGEPRAYLTWLNECADIESLSDLVEAVSDEGFYRDTLQPGDGQQLRIKAFKAVAFQKAVLAQSVETKPPSPTLVEEPPSSPLLAPTAPAPPSLLLCPLTNKPMVEPVTAADGYTYERSAIMQWFSQSVTDRGVVSPVTYLPLVSLSLFPNLAVPPAVPKASAVDGPKGLW